MPQLNRNIRKKAGLAVMGLCALVMSGCATPPDARNNASDEAIVQERAQARWDALIAGNMGDAYKYLPPGLRKTMTLNMYQNKIRLGKWESAKVVAATCEAERCMVDVKIKLAMMGGLELEEPLHETWIKEDGTWWHSLKKK